MTLWDAAMQGDVDALKRALDEAPETLNQPGIGGWPALHLAAHFGHVACVRELLARGADVQARSANEMTNLALHAAAAGRVVEKRAEILQLLLDAGTPVDATQHGGYTALDAARANNDAASERVLLAAGAVQTKAAGS